MASNEDKDVEKRDEEASAADEEDQNPTASVTSWFSGWYDTAKKKIAETNEFMKHDLQEFTQAVQTDASRFVAATANTMKEKLHINVDMEEASTTTRTVKNSLSNFLGNIASKVGPIPPDDDENAGESAIMGTSSGTKVLSPSEARIYAIRTDPATFCNEPDNEDEYYSWLPGFNVEDQKTEISSLMLDCSQIRSLYTKLVPSAVSHSDFWARYFFKLHQHEKAEERRAMLVERAHKTHNDIEWDDEDDWVQPKNIPLEVNDEGIDKSASITGDLKTHPEMKDEIQKEPISYVQTEANSPPAKDSTAVLEKYDQNVDDKVETVVGTSRTDNSDAANIKIAEQSDKAPEKSANLEVKTDSQKTEVSEAGKSPTSDEKPKSEDLSTGAKAIKTPSSGESSDDWEKDFELDMTEDEIQEVLKESDAADIDFDIEDIGDDWDSWE